MHEMLTILTDVRSVCLSRGSSRLHCAKMPEQIKMFFKVYTPGSPWNIVLDPLLSLEWLKLDLKLCVPMDS